METPTDTCAPAMGKGALMESRIRRASVPHRAEPGLNDGEFVASETGERVPGPQKVRQAAGHLLDEIVAGRMPVGIVDVLEAVEVEEVDGDAALHPAEAADLVIEPLGKDQAVRQT
jgi:hypothetical protein